MQMLHQCDAEYIMFSDQDDVWNNNKISVTLAAMQKCEALHPFDPILVHSDLIVADKDLNRISYSFMKYAGFNGKYSSLNRLLVQNNITGCTLMINRKLAELSHNTDCTRIIMHDWWLGLIAAAFGEICYLDCPTIKYRQHSNNQVGAKKANSIPQLLKSLKNKLKGNLLSTCTLQQAEYLMEKYKDSLPPDAYLTINQYIDLKKKNKFQRLRIIIKNKFLRQNPLQAFLQILFC